MGQRASGFVAGHRSNMQATKTSADQAGGGRFVA
jgi:hypothetical protein